MNEVLLKFPKRINNILPRVLKSMNIETRIKNWQIVENWTEIVGKKHNLLIKRRIRYCKTTNSDHSFRKYNNLIKDIEIIKPNQVWVSDLTYINTREGFLYLSC